MANDYIKNEIRANYITEDLSSLSSRLGLKKDTVRKIANRMGLSRRAIISNAIVDGFKKCNVCISGCQLVISLLTQELLMATTIDVANASILKKKFVLKSAKGVKMNVLRSAKEI